MFVNDKTVTEYLPTLLRYDERLTVCAMAGRNPGSIFEIGDDGRLVAVYAFHH